MDDETRYRIDGVNCILTAKESETALGVIDVLREGKMMTEALEVISRRFRLQPRAVADWYYSQRSL